jgi:hypothetical protein
VRAPDALASGESVPTGVARIICVINWVAANADQYGIAVASMSLGHERRFADIEVPHHGQRVRLQRRPVRPISGRHYGYTGSPERPGVSLSVG